MVGVTPLLAPVVLEGRHVRLEPLALDHLTDLLEVGLDPDLWRWSPDRIEVADDLRRYLARALAERERGEALPFAIVERAGERAIGSTRYANAAPEHRRLEIGWTWIGRAWQRTAVNTETKWLMLRHAFETLGCLRVELKTDALNARSRAAILRMGATEEGTLRSHMVTHDGRLRDSVYYSIVAEEWPYVRARLEERLAGVP
jgi:RimJ/RimL family protein N-acetyltransferase